LVPWRKLHAKGSGEKRGEGVRVEIVVGPKKIVHREWFSGITERGGERGVGIDVERGVTKAETKKVRLGNI